MDPTLILWFLPIVIILVGWTLMADEWGVLVAFDATGIVVRTAYRRREIRWGEVEDRVVVVPTFLPRVLLKVGKRPWLLASRRIVVLMRDRDLDTRFLAELRRAKVVVETDDPRKQF